MGIRGMDEHGWRQPHARVLQGVWHFSAVEGDGGVLWSCGAGLQPARTQPLLNMIDFFNRGSTTAERISGGRGGTRPSPKPKQKN
jgi:hypothetical protein